MKKIFVLLCVIMCGITVYATPAIDKKSAADATKSKLVTRHLPVKKAAFATSITLTTYSYVGNYRLILGSSSGETQYAFPSSPGSSSITVPSGIYTYVGIAPAGGSPSSHNFSGSACTTNYSSSGTSAIYYNVNLTCGSASFSIN